MSLFSKNLRFLRKKGNLNQEQISLLFNKRANTIGNWENQKSEPSLAELMKLGEYFQVSTEDLLHTNLEQQNLFGELLGRTPVIADQRTKLKSTEEPSSIMAGESNPDAFWFILRELRALSEKVDLLVSGMETTGTQKKSDKSYH
jgi:transcriptional regulator with XRE-family HTH domain